MALGVLRLQDRQRIALFVRKDPFERFVSCFVYVPRDRYNTELRLRFQKILEASFAGEAAAFSSHFGEETALVRLHIIIRTNPGQIPAYSIPDITAQLAEAGRTFSDRLKDALIASEGEDRGLVAWRRYADAFSGAYRERFGPEAAVEDIAKIETVLSDGVPLALNLYRDVDSADEELRFRVFNKANPLPLSDVLPMLEALGLRVISEVGVRDRAGGRRCQGLDARLRDDLAGRHRSRSRQGQAAVRGRFRRRVGRHGRERRVQPPRRRGGPVGARGQRAARLCQVPAPGRHPVQPAVYGETCWRRYPQIARRIVDLFHTMHDPKARKDAEVRSRGLLVELDHLFDAVTSLDDDRILRRFLNLVRVTLRTNYFQPAERPAQAVDLVQARQPPGRRAAAAAPAGRGLRLQPARRGDPSARRQGRARRHPLVRSPRGFPHRDPRPDEGADGQERGHRAGRLEGRLLRQASAGAGSGARGGHRPRRSSATRS